MTLDGLRTALIVFVAFFQPCNTPGINCAGKHNLFKYFADVQARVFGLSEKTVTESKTRSLFKP